MAKKIGDVIKRIKNQYDVDPENWRVFGGRDPRGNSDIFIQQHPKIWQIKLKPIDPFRNVAYGSPVRRLDDEINQKIGATPSQDDLLRLFGMMVPVNKDENIIASGIENFSPKKTNHIKKILKEKNPNQEKELQDEVEKEFGKKFPERKNLFT